MQALNTRVAELEQQSAASKNQPKPVTQPDFEAARKALDERLSQVEQAQTADNRAGDLQALQARMGDIEARLKKAATPVAAPGAPPRRSNPRRRSRRSASQAWNCAAARRFLSIAAPGVAAVRELRLLREGDAIGAWQLQVIEAHAAVFRVDGQTQRIALP